MDTKFEQGVFDAAQREFVAVAASLTDERWVWPSLCQGWSVRDVVIHTAWHTHLPAVRLSELVQFKRLGEDEFYRR